MDIWEAIGDELLDSTDITGIVGTKVYHGERPAGSAPCINYFEVSYVLLAYSSIEAPRYQISCRASTPGVVQDLARKVCVLFQNMKKCVDSTFDIQMATIENKFLLKEPDTNLWHVPIDIRFIYNESIVS